MLATIYRSIRAARLAFIAAVLCIVPLVAASCTVLPDPAAMGCTQEESNRCRVVAAGLVVKAANITIGEQLARGVVTPSEAGRLRALTKQAEDAVVAARAALAFEGGDIYDKLRLLDSILAQILREQTLASVGG